jgi:hypothetical protein
VVAVSGRVVHTRVSGTGFIEAEEHGYAPDDPVTLTPTETYRSLVGALEHEQWCATCADDGCPEDPDDDGVTGCGCDSRRVLALLREADTGEGA